MVYEKIYIAKTGHIKKEDVQPIGEFLEHCKKRTPEKILEEIHKNPHHIIYGYVFNNSNKEAAYQYRLSQVRWLLREIIYKVVDADQPNIRLFYNVVNAQGEKEYKTMEEVFSNPEFGNQVVQMALQELINWSERYKAYSELAGIIRTIQKEIKKIKRQKDYAHKG